MYLDESEEIFGYWEENPPTYQMVGLIARMLGWEGAKREGPAVEPPPMPDIPVEIREALGKAAGVPTPIISIEEMRERNRRRVVERIAEREARTAANAE